MNPAERPLTAEQVRHTLADAYERLEQELSESGALPRPGRTVLHWLRVPLELLGAVQLGLVTACLSMFVLFVLINLLFHLHL